MPIEDELLEACASLDGEISRPSRKPVEGSPITEATDLPEDALEVPCGCLCGS